MMAMQIKILHARFGPRYSEHERIVFGSTNTTGHGGCWIHESACDAPDCIMADLPGTLIEIEVARVMELDMFKEMPIAATNFEGKV
jgi:hypothetical protein